MPEVWFRNELLAAERLAVDRRTEVVALGHTGRPREPARVIHRRIGRHFDAVTPLGTVIDTAATAEIAGTTRASREAAEASTRNQKARQ